MEHVLFLVLVIFARVLYQKQVSFSHFHIFQVKYVLFRNVYEKTLEMGIIEPNLAR